MSRIDLSSFEFPKRYEEDKDYFPMLGIDIGDDTYMHPVIEAVRNGGTIESVEMIGDEWYDDHCPCCDVAVVVDGKKYGFSAWWLSMEGFKMIVRAECGNDKAIKDFKQYIIIDDGYDPSYLPMPQEVLDRLK